VTVPGNPPPAPKPPRLSATRLLYWGAIVIHVTGLLSALYLFAIGGPTRLVIAFVLLAIIGAGWITWTNRTDENERSAHLFERSTFHSQPPSFSDFRDYPGPKDSL
jgi:hypothetical protein